MYILALAGGSGLTSHPVIPGVSSATALSVACLLPNPLCLWPLPFGARVACHQRPLGGSRTQGMEPPHQLEVAVERVAAPSCRGQAGAAPGPGLGGQCQRRLDSVLPPDHAGGRSCTAPGLPQKGRQGLWAPASGPRSRREPSRAQVMWPGHRGHARRELNVVLAQARGAFHTCDWRVGDSQRRLWWGAELGEKEARGGKVAAATLCQGSWAQAPAAAHLGMCWLSLV